MASFIVLFFVVGMEIMCLLFGAALVNADAPRPLWTMWGLALVSIPVTGFLAVWAINRRRKRTEQSNRRLGLAASLLGGGIALAWGVKSVLLKTNPELSSGGLIAGLACVPALYLTSAGITLLFTSRSPATSPETENQSV